MKITQSTTPKAYDYVRSSGICASATPQEQAKRIIRRRLAAR